MFDLTVFVPDALPGTKLYLVQTELLQIKVMIPGFPGGPLWPLVPRIVVPGGPW